MILQGNS